jgi:hypothetical protein
MLASLWGLFLVPSYFGSSVYIQKPKRQKLGLFTRIPTTFIAKVKSIRTARYL